MKHATDYEESFRDNFPSTPNTHLLGKAEQQLQTQVRGGEFIVPAGDFFALGDNPDLSLDSRYEGTYPLQAIIGQPVFLYFSAEPPADREQMRIVLSHTRWNRIFLAPR